MSTALEDFKNVFPVLTADLVVHFKQFGMPYSALVWFERNLKYNVSAGSLSHGVVVVNTAAILIGRRLTRDEFFRSATLGWMVELLNAFLFMLGDIMDGSTTRRGTPCWHLEPGVGMIAMNDALMLELAVYILLQKYFSLEDSYTNLLELFHDVTFQTKLGRCCDMVTAAEDTVDLEKFSHKSYSFIASHKSAYYSLYLPVALALHCCHKATTRNLRMVKEIAIPMGEYLHIRNDYLGNFANPTPLHKVETGIQNNKCSWLIYEALRAANPRQRNGLQENYGRRNSVKEAKVVGVYEELHLHEVYRKYEENSIHSLKSLLFNVDESEGLKKEIFMEILRKSCNHLKHADIWEGW